jgi:hypothetical protein
MTSMADSWRKSSVFHIREQQSKTSRTGKRAIQLAGSAVEGSLDLDLVFLSNDQRSKGSNHIFARFVIVNRTFWHQF